MNQFQYIVKIKEIEKLKTGVAIDKEIRELTQKIQEVTKGSRQWSSNVTSDNIQEIELLYKCLSKVSPMYKGKKGMPGKFGEFEHMINQKIGNYYLKNYKDISYDRFVDTFKESNILTVDGSNYITELKKLDYIYRDNPLTFSINYQFYSSSKFNTSLESMRELQFRDDTGTVGSFYYGNLLEIHHTAKNITEYKSTIFNDMLDKMYKAIELSKADPKEKPDTGKDIAELLDLKDTLEIVGERLNVSS